jgi:hypothetical protein
MMCLIAQQSAAVAHAQAPFIEEGKILSAADDGRCRSVIGGLSEPSQERVRSQQGCMV